MFKKYKEKFIGDREFYANLIRLIIDDRAARHHKLCQPAR